MFNGHANKFETSISEETSWPKFTQEEEED